MARGDAHHDPTIARVVAMNYAMCDQSLNGIKGRLQGPSEMPNYDLMYPTDEEERLADYLLRDRTGKYYINNRDTNDCRFKALNCIRAAQGTAVVAGTVMEGKRPIELADNITAVPSLSSDDISAYAFIKRYTGELVESTAELCQELRAALGPNVPAGENGADDPADDDNNIDENGNDGHRARTRARTRAQTRARAGGDGDDEIPPADDDDGAGAEPPRLSTPTNAGTNADGNAAGDIGGFNTPPANASNAVNSGSGRRGGTRSSGSSSSVLSSIRNSIRIRRRNGGRSGKGAAWNLRDLPSPGSTSGRSSGTPLSRSTSASASASASGENGRVDAEDGDGGGWTMDDVGESPVGRDPPPADQVPMVLVDGVPEGGLGGGGRARGNVHGDPMYDGDNEGDDDDDDDFEVEVEVDFTGNGVVGDDHRGRRRGGHRSLGTGKCTMRGTSRPTSPKDGPRGGDLRDRSSSPSHGVGRDPPSIGRSPASSIGYSEGQGGGEDPPTLGDLVVGPGDAGLNAGAGLNAAAAAGAGAGLGVGMGMGMGVGDGSGSGGQAGLDGVSMYETAEEEIEDGIDESEEEEDDIGLDGGNGVGDDGTVASNISAGQSLSGAGAGAGANNDDVLAIIAQMQERIDALEQENDRLKNQVNELEDIFDREQKHVATKDANARKQNEIFEKRLAQFQDREDKIRNILESIRGKLGG